MPGGAEDGNTVRSFLRRDHARLEGLHARMLDDIDEVRAADRRGVWRRFEAGLLDHMAAEERHLLRPFGQLHPPEAAALRAQHAEFRRALARMGTNLELHRDELERFIAAVCDHGRLEDHLLYRWAEREVDPAVQEKIARELFHRDRDAAFGRRG